MYTVWNLRPQKDVFEIEGVLYSPYFTSRLHSSSEILSVYPFAGDFYEKYPWR